MNTKETYNEGGLKRLVFVSFLLVVMTTLCLLRAHAQSTNQNHLMLSAGALYERGFDATIAYQHETKYHNSWEYFASYYIKYEDDPLAGHITKDSFWNSYNTWLIGAAYKPCVSRGRNHHGNVRIGVSCGSDLSDIIGGGHLGYEHSYALYSGWEIFFQVREDFILRGKDNFRTGVSLGVKVPL